MIIIAKNLLEGKTCHKCEHRLGNNCLYKYSGSSSLPEHNTCFNWKKQYFRNMNVKWTKETEIDLAKYLTSDAEEELIKEASKIMQEIGNINFEK